MIKNLKREKLLVASNIAVMTITFLMLGAFISLVAFTQTGLRTLEKQAQITIFFKDEFVEDQILELQKELEVDERISSTNYVSKEDAFKIFTELNKDDPLLLESISASILPASLEIRTENIDDLAVFSEDLSKLDGVEEVKFFKDVIESFKKWSRIAYTVGFLVVALFIIISFSVVMVTLRITIDSRGKEIEIMKLVGASNAYVKKPLIQQGVFFGLSSALIASIILILISVIIQLSGVFGGYVEFVFLPDFLINLTVFSMAVSFLLVVLGIALGYFGSLAAIKKYLKY
jgi:cell division transport system permease protein